MEQTLETIDKKFGQPTDKKDSSADMSKVTDDMKNELQNQGYSLDDVEVVDIKGDYDPNSEGSACEALFKTKDGGYFVCGQNSEGTKTFKLTSDQATEFAQDHYEPAYM